MIVAQGRDDIGADASFGQPLRQSRGKPDCAEARMHAKADPRPLTVGSRVDDTKPIILSDQGELVRTQR